MKKFFLICASLSIITTCFNSCSASNDDVVSGRQFSEDQISNKINLVGSSNTEEVSNKVNVIIFTVYIGRASQGCLHGWGFCNFTWGSLVSSGKTNESKAIQVVQQGGVNEQKYFEIYSDRAIPSDVPLSDLDLTVDADLSTQVVDSDTGISSTVILKQGIYHFDTTVGQYGGFKITLQ